MKEHKDACNQGQLEKSAIAEHAWRQDHPIERHDTQVLHQASRRKKLLVQKRCIFGWYLRMAVSTGMEEWNCMIAESLLLGDMSKGVNTTTYATGMLHMAPW